VDVHRFHATTGIGELYAFARGTSAGVLANVALRIVVVGLFAYYGLRPTATRKRNSMSRSSHPSRA
jgi:hypothetical protein